MVWVRAASRPSAMVVGVLSLSVVCAQAQKEAEEKKFGDWITYESRDFDQDPPPPPKGVADAARTLALDGRDAAMGFICWPYSVDYFLYEDKEFSEALKDVPPIDSAQPIYTKTNKQDGLYVSLSWGGYSSRSFDETTESLISAGNLMICPVKDEKHPACLTFSLRGIAAALKAICPKR